MSHLEVSTPVTLVTTAETVIGAIGPTNIPGPVPTSPPVGVPTIITGEVNVTPGTTTSGIVIRARQGVGLTGAVVGVAETDTAAAAAPVSIPIEFEDPVGSASGYTLTAVQTAATANGTVNYASADFNPQ